MRNVLGTIDLNSLDNKPKSELYKALKPLCKDPYDKLDRIIFTANSPLTRTFDKLPADLLIELQKMLVYLNIPNFFCEIISPVDLSNELEYVCKKYAVDEKPIRNTIKE